MKIIVLGNCPGYKYNLYLKVLFVVYVCNLKCYNCIILVGIHIELMRLEYFLTNLENCYCRFNVIYFSPKDLIL